MKTLIATAIALTLTAPAFADTSAAQAHFALGNDSPAERIIGDTSTGNPEAALAKFRAVKDSAAERAGAVNLNNDVTVSRNVQAFFALGNDSAAERVVK